MIFEHDISNYRNVTQLKIVINNNYYKNGKKWIDFVWWLYKNNVVHQGKYKK